MKFVVDRLRRGRVPRRLGPGVRGPAHARRTRAVPDVDLLADADRVAILAHVPPGGWSAGVRPQRTPGRALSRRRPAGRHQRLRARAPRRSRRPLRRRPPRAQPRPGRRAAQRRPSTRSPTIRDAHPPRGLFLARRGPRRPHPRLHRLGGLRARHHDRPDAGQRAAREPWPRSQLRAAGARVAAARTRAPSTRRPTSAWPGRRCASTARPATATTSTSAPPVVRTRRDDWCSARSSAGSPTSTSRPRRRGRRRLGGAAPPRRGARRRPSRRLGLDAIAAHRRRGPRPPLGDRPRARARPDHDPLIPTPERTPHAHPHPRSDRRRRRASGHQGRGEPVAAPLPAELRARRRASSASPSCCSLSVSGTAASRSSSPWTKLVQGAVFGVALTLVVFAGAELFTGNVMVMVQGLVARRIRAVEAAAVLVASLIGNFVGSVGFAALVHGGGVAHRPRRRPRRPRRSPPRTPLTGPQLLWRSILCNLLVCLALWMASRTRVRRRQARGALVGAAGLHRLRLRALGRQHDALQPRRLRGQRDVGRSSPATSAWTVPGNMIGGGILVGLGLRLDRDAGEATGSRSSTNGRPRPPPSCEPRRGSNASGGRARGGSPGGAPPPGPARSRRAGPAASPRRPPPRGGRRGRCPRPGGAARPSPPPHRAGRRARRPCPARDGQLDVHAGRRPAATPGGRRGGCRSTSSRRWRRASRTSACTMAPRRARPGSTGWSIPCAAGAGRADRTDADRGDRRR